MPVYEGCIEEVRSTELLLRFDENFQRRYDGELYNVTFKMNRLDAGILYPPPLWKKFPVMYFYAGGGGKKCLGFFR